MGDATKVRVLFGSHPAWEANLRKKIDSDRFECQFGNLGHLPLDEFDAVVPLKLEDYAPLNKARASNSKVRALFPKPEVVALCHDKYQFNRFVSNTDNANLIPPMFEGVSPSLPFILKRKHDEYGNHSYLIRTEEDMSAHKAEIGSDDFFMQSYVSGTDEYTTHVLLADGKIRHHVNVIYGMGADFYVKSEKFTQKTTKLNDDDSLLPIFAKLLQAIGYNEGTCCLNYKFIDSNPMIFEINPRFGGSLFLDINRYLAAYLAALP